ncbi:MAG TPA: ribose 5-phosphate isomerase B [Mollicutes bacterium]|jgi:ribose 5-phosphate isomerase B|nr:ribose 5-phosphate isomerase B [Mollicutes bacterium]
MNIGIATDHRGVTQKKKLIKYLEAKGHNIYNYGTDSEESVDYPDYAFLIGNKINEGEIELGILICGTGVGMCIASNKVRGIRCAKVDNTKEAKLSRLHNNANVISLSSYMGLTKMKDILDVFIKTKFSNEERHLLRLNKVDNYNNEY